MSPSSLLLVLAGAVSALDYTPALKDYGSYGYDHQPSYYGFHPKNKYSYTPYGDYGYNIPADSQYVPQYGYGSRGAPSYGYDIPTYGYGHPAPYGAHEGPHSSSPVLYGFPKGYGSNGMSEVPTYGHPTY